MGKLTTHVLDTALGTPAQGLKIDIFRGGELLHSVTTNHDGRVDVPLLQGEALVKGQYELRFHAGDYLRRTTPGLKDPLFLDIIPIAFGIADVAQNYHVPLLLQPFGYSTYRGS